MKSLEENETHKHLYNQLDTEITDHEIINATKKIKTKKATYSDQISNEMIKASADILIKGFNKAFNTILTAGKFPTSWCEGLITPIYKTGNRSDPNNYRGICVSSSLGKFFCSILNERLINYTKEKDLIHPCQIGFMRGNRSADHILTLKTLHEKYVQQQNNSKIYACFV